MGATDAARQRRYRRHKRGDHSLCDPSRCPETSGVTVTPPVTAPVTRHAAPGLRAGGRRLWDDMGGDRLAGGRRALLAEACRIVDRLDALDRLISGDARDWLEMFDDRGNPDRQEVVIDKLLAESRQQATTLARITAELRQSASAEKPATGGSVLDQLAARRAARIADAAG